MFFEKFLGVKNVNGHKVVNLFGLKMKFRNLGSTLETLKSKLELIEEQNQDFYYDNLAKRIHPRVFGKYKDCNAGKSVVLFACGPSAQYYEVVNDASHVAINNAVLYDKIKFDQIFMHDDIAVSRMPEIMKNYDADKFCAYMPSPYCVKRSVRKDSIININAKQFIVSDPYLFWADWDCPSVINPDITSGYLYDRGGGTVFSALQFILYTNPKKLYLVGCDCSSEGYFWGNEKFGSNNLLRNTIGLWKCASQVIRTLYPDLEVYSINPVNLKGMFNDIYTQSYVDAHPELKNENVKIYR